MGKRQGFSRVEDVNLWRPESLEQVLERDAHLALDAADPFLLVPRNTLRPTVAGTVATWTELRRTVHTPEGCRHKSYLTPSTPALSGAYSQRQR